MAFHHIAYGPDELTLLTVDGSELLAYDAHTEAPKWRLDLGGPLSAVLFADTTALPGCQGTSPFRSPPTRAAVVVHADGKLSMVDTSLGQLLGEVAALGTPTAVASSVHGSVALATASTVHVWRSGIRCAIPTAEPVTSLAFSGDGGKVALGNAKGKVRILNVANATETTAPEELLATQVQGAITEIVQLPAGDWILGGTEGGFRMAPSGATRIGSIHNVRRMVLSPNGDRLAVQVSERAVVVFEWPNLATASRIEYTDRPVRGLAFGSGNWLGVALDHGDGNKIDVISGAVHRTDTHPERTHRSWTLRVQSKKDLLSKEQEDIRLLKTPPAPSSGFGTGGRLGIGAMISIALLGLRVCVRASTSSSSPSYNYSGLNLPTAATKPECDLTCALARLDRLRTTCGDTACGKEAQAARVALGDGRCEAATSALERITPRSGAKDVTFDVMYAKLGLRQACASGTVRPRTVAHAQVVKLSGPQLSPTVLPIPETEHTGGETPRAIWAAPDGTVFVATTTPMRQYVVYERKTTAGTFRAYGGRPTRSEFVKLFGRSASDVYVATEEEIRHYDGTKWTDVPTPHGGDTRAAALAGSELLAVGDDDRIYRRSGAAWNVEAIAGTSVRALFGSGPNFAFGTGSENESGRVFARRGGAWSLRSLGGADAGIPGPVLAGWVSPSGDAFFATDEVLRDGTASLVTLGADGRSQVSPTDAAVTDLWGRSSKDVYAATADGLLHYDGKAWSGTSFQTRATFVSGTATDLFVLRSGPAEPKPDTSSSADDD